jgi:hypothetical protein
LLRPGTGARREKPGRVFPLFFFAGGFKYVAVTQSVKKSDQIISFKIKSPAGSRVLPLKPNRKNHE